jgi:histidyl-tRNA synthetase
MKYANNINARHVLVLGDNEIKEGKARIKNMENGSEHEVLLGSLETEIRKYIL